MCLSTVYRTAQPDNVIMEYVRRIAVEGDRITLTDVLGEEKTIVGTLTLADLTGGVIEIQCSDQAVADAG